jgi:D-3-phosphoglycerate dehydrogenase
MPQWTILLPQPIAEKALVLLRAQKDFAVLVFSPEEREKVWEYLPQAHALLVRSSFRVTREVIDRASNLRVICR